MTLRPGFTPGTVAAWAGLALLGWLALPPMARGEPCTYCDLNRDFVVDQADLLAFVACMTGPGLPIAPECARFDLDGDADIDQSDFGLLQACLAEPAGPIDPVISEFMASNDNTLDDEDGESSDWLEIYNPTAAPIDLAGWYLTGKADNLTKWRFPAPTILPARGFLVVFASNKNRAVAGRELHTSFNIKASGEYLALVKPDGVTVASQYAPVFPPQITDVSFGMAMTGAATTLIAPGAPCSALIPTADIGLDWTDSPYNEQGWTAGTTGVGYDRSTSPVDYLPLIGLDVGAMYNVNRTVYIRIPFDAPDPTAYDRLVLSMKYDDGFLAYLNGVLVAYANPPTEATWNAGTGGGAVHDDPEAMIYVDYDLSEHIGLLRPTGNVLAIHGLNATLSSRDLLILPELKASGSALSAPRSHVYLMQPTPGSGNIGGVSAIGPLVGDTTRTPLVPTDAEDLLITAKVTPTFSPVAAVQMHYRVMYGATTSLSMADDGLHGDGAAGDGVYGATIPASASTAGQMVRWYFTATDTEGRATRWPLFTDPLNSPEYLGTVVANPGVSSQLPILQWFVADTAAANTVSGTRCSVFFLDEFYDNVFVRIRGNTSLGWPKHHYKFDFNSGNHFRFDPNQGRVEEFNLNSTYSDKAYIRQVLSAETYRDTGGAYGIAFPMRVQQNGAFFSVAVFVEQPDEDYLERNGLDPYGALYKMADYNVMTSVSGAEKKTRLYENTSDLQAFITGINQTNTAARTRFLFDNLDIPASINYVAATTLIHDNDHVAKNYYMYRDTRGSGEWQFLPWDKDLTFGRNFTLTGGVLNDTMWANVDGPLGSPYAAAVSPSHPLFGDSDHQKADNLWNRLIDAMNDTPEIRAMYLRRLRTVMDDLLQPPGTPAGELKYETRVNELVAQMQADVALDLAKWAGSGIYYGQNQDFATAIGHMTAEYLAPRRVHLFTTHGPTGTALIPEAQPPDASISFGVIEHSPASGIQDEEYIELVNANSYAVDITDWQLQVYDDVVGEWEEKHTFRPGTVIRANSSLYATPKASVFRARTTSPKAGEGLFIQGDYDHHIAPGEMLRIVNTAGVVVATATAG